MLFELQHSLTMIIDAWKPILSATVAAIAWASGVPKQIIWKFRAHMKQRRLQRRLAAGVFDDATLKDAFQCYVRPKFSNNDPSVEVEPVKSLTYARDDLFGMVDRFLTTVAKRHMFILADSGMGKTSFLLNYFYANYSGFLKPKFKLKIASLSRAGVEEVISKVPVEDVGDTILLLDALDEDVKAMGRADDRVRELLALSENFKAVIVTCRTQFFRNDEAIPVKTGLIKIGAVRASSSKEYEFERVYLAPFDDQQIRKYLNNRFPGIFSFRLRKSARRVIKKVPALSVRPMLLAHMADILNDDLVVSLPVDVYTSMVRAWVKREDRWIDEKELLRFSRGIAFDLYSRSGERGGELAEPDEIAQVSKDLGINVDLDRLTSRSLLNRYGDGRFKFSHRSIMEYFVVDALLVSIAAPVQIQLTDQMTKFLLQRVCRIDSGDEHIFFDVKSRAKVVSAMMQSGYATNFSLYREVPRNISHEAISKAVLSVESRLGGGCTFAEMLVEVLSVVPGREGWPSPIWISCEGVVDGFTTMYLSSWTPSKILITQFDISTRALLSCFSSAEDLTGPFALQGEIISQGYETYVSWRLRLRVDLFGLNAHASHFQVPNAMAMRYDRSCKMLTIEIVEGFLTGDKVFSQFGIDVNLKFRRYDFPSVASLPIRA